MRRGIGRASKVRAVLELMRGSVEHTTRREAASPERKHTLFSAPTHKIIHPINTKGKRRDLSESIN